MRLKPEDIVTQFRNAAPDAAHSVKMVRLLEAKRALKKWRTPVETAEEIKARQASQTVTPASAAARPV